MSVGPGVTASPVSSGQQTVLETANLSSICPSILQKAFATRYGKRSKQSERKDFQYASVELCGFIVLVFVFFATYFRVKGRL